MPSRFIRCEMVRTEAGSSVVGLAAYVARARREDHSGMVFNFAHRGAELLGHGLILPGDAPDWAHDPAALWRAAERAEQTIDRRSGERRWKKGGQIARSSRLAIVIGRAGTGKSHHTLQAVRRAFEQAGKRVIGLAPTNAVVADLRRDGYRQAATLHRELGALAHDPKRWDRNTVVMVDEAAMVDNTMLATLLAAAERCGARLILAGERVTKSHSGSVAPTLGNSSPRAPHSPRSAPGPPPNAHASAVLRWSTPAFQSRPPCTQEASVDPQPRGSDWMQITPKAGSLFHANSLQKQAGVELHVADGPR